MEEKFAEKLRLWLISMMTLLLGTVSASITTLLGRSCIGSNVWTCIGMSAEAMVIFALLFVALAIWHAFDFIQNRKPRDLRAALLASYPALFGPLSILLVLIVLMSTGNFHVTYCTTPEPGTIMFDGCETRPDRVLESSFYLLLLFVIIVCMGKAVISIRSRLKKAT